MNKTKHTPGPWRVASPAYGTLDIMSPVNAIARLYTERAINTQGPSFASAESDARLIAAAPDLLEALRELVQWLDVSELTSTRPGGHGPLAYKGTEYNVVTDARTAILKAELT